MQATPTDFQKEVLERFRSSEKGVKLKLPTINLIGSIDKSILKEIEYFENIYFSLSEKIKIQDLEMSLLKQAKPTLEEGEAIPVIAEGSKDVTIHASEEPENTMNINAVSEHSCSEIEAKYADCSQIYLREVGHSVAATYLGHGSKYIQKANKKCFGIFLNQSGDNFFLQGTQLQDVVVKENLVAGDYVKITKTEQFRRAADRSHAKAAKFSLEIIELAPENN